MRRLATALCAALIGGAGAFVFQAVAQQSPAIESAPLTQLNGWSVGALSQGQGALAPTLWQGSDAAAIAALFDRLPATIDSPAARALARRALVSPGAAPTGDAATDAMRKRFSALGRMGLADDLSVMAAGSGASASDVAIAQYAAQAELARGRMSEACARGRQAQTDQPPAFILRLRAFCAAATDGRAAADLALEMARGAGAESAWFRAAIGGVGEGAPRPAVQARYADSLSAAISLAANLRAPANPLNGASTLALAVIARSDRAAPLLRAQAAALAYRRGAIPASEARTILHSIPATVTTGLPALAIALRRVEAAANGPDAGVAIAQILTQATTPSDFAAAAMFFRTDIANLTSAPNAAAALIYARAAVIAGDLPLAQRLITNAADNHADAIGVARVQTAISIAQGESAATVVARRRAASGPQTARAAARDVAILAAMGFELDADARAFLLATTPFGGRPLDPGLMASLTAAAQSHALGETALLAALATAPGAQTVDAHGLDVVLRALRDAGLNDAARRIAIEAMLS